MPPKLRKGETRDGLGSTSKRLTQPKLLQRSRTTGHQQSPQKEPSSPPPPARRVSARNATIGIPKPREDQVASPGRQRRGAFRLGPLGSALPTTNITSLRTVWSVARKTFEQEKQAGNEAGNAEADSEDAECRAERSGERHKTKLQMMFHSILVGTKKAYKAQHTAENLAAELKSQMKGQREQTGTEDPADSDGSESMASSDSESDAHAEVDMAANHLCADLENLVKDAFAGCSGIQKDQVTHQLKSVLSMAAHINSDMKELLASMERRSKELMEMQSLFSESTKEARRLARASVEVQGKKDDDRQVVIQTPSEQDCDSPGANMRRESLAVINERKAVLSFAARRLKGALKKKVAIAGERSPDSPRRSMAAGSFKMAILADRLTSDSKKNRLTRSIDTFRSTLKTAVRSMQKRGSMADGDAALTKLLDQVTLFESTMVTAADAVEDIKAKKEHEELTRSSEDSRLQSPALASRRHSFGESPLSRGRFGSDLMVSNENSMSPTSSSTPMLSPTVIGLRSEGNESGHGAHSMTSFLKSPMARKSLSSAPETGAMPISPASYVSPRSGMFPSLETPALSPPTSPVLSPKFAEARPESADSGLMPWDPELLFEYPKREAPPTPVCQRWEEPPEIGSVAYVTEDAFLLECAAAASGLRWPDIVDGRPDVQKLGCSGTVVKVSLADMTAQLSRGIGWVPIRALEGFEDWRPAKKVLEWELTVRHQAQRRHGKLSSLLQLAPQWQESIQGEGCKAPKKLTKLPQLPLESILPAFCPVGKSSSPRSRRISDVVRTTGTFVVKKKKMLAPLPLPLPGLDL
eukprot:TRINITY_DN14260_c0_g1_i1.p1 TRINITY_DN14260_c0_g1~~TRINITY_DN14260_c0_g1_i1.p1  ORF type:complete len:811 (+),score=166.51 TRINITY_DN14260_c0_g1_i1:184-2616(+)